MLLDLLLAALPLAEIASRVLAMLWPKGPAWMGPFVGELILVTKDLVEELTGDDYKHLSGRSKFEAVVIEVREALDDAFDEVPEWSTLGEVKRDRIIGGIAEFVLFVHRASEGRAEPKERRPLIRLRKRVRGA